MKLPSLWYRSHAMYYYGHETDGYGGIEMETESSFLGRQIWRFSDLKKQIPCAAHYETSVSVV